MNIISKPIMAIANKMVAITAPTLKIREEKKQTKLQEFIAKISLILHNLFTKGEFNIDLNDAAIHQVLSQIAFHCQAKINQYNTNPHAMDSAEDRILIQAFPSVIIRFEIVDHELRLTLIENDLYYYFPQKILLLSIDLNDQKKRTHYLQVTQKVIDYNNSKVEEKPIPQESIQQESKDPVQPEKKLVSLTNDPQKTVTDFNEGTLNLCVTMLGYQIYNHGQISSGGNAKCWIHI